MKKELRLMKGNEAFGEAAIRAGTDGYFGYPITPQSEVLEYLTSEKPHERTGMVVLQAESEVAAINMLYGGAGCAKKVMTSSSSPGISLMQEGISYMAGAELPCLLLNVVRGGPGLGTIQPSQSDYFQSVKGGGHGDYKLITLAPSSVQEMYDFVKLGYDLAFRYRTPVMLLSDGAIGQMMEKVEIDEQVPRLTEEEIREKYPWATLGRYKMRERNIITSLNLQSTEQEKHNEELQKKYRQIEAKEVVYEKIECDDADYLFMAYGTAARICQKSVRICREKGIKVGLLRPITLYPFPVEEVFKMAGKVKGILSVEMNAGQMIEDIRLAAHCKVPVEHYGRMGGMVPSPVEIANALENKFLKG
jgi:2-oxoglutarate/2-oxoacid ferredoxin oxidoreductase subunit alpha